MSGGGQGGGELYSEVKLNKFKHVQKMGPGPGVLFGVWGVVCMIPGAGTLYEENPPDRMTDRQTDKAENITFSTSLAGGNISMLRGRHSQYWIIDLHRLLF